LNVGTSNPRKALNGLNDWNRYRLKHPIEVRSVIATLSRFVRLPQTQACNTGRFRVSGIPETWK
jgi:hypothetical protein